MRVELNEDDDGKKSSIALKLWVEDAKKLKGKYKDTGAIEFSFDLVNEVPEVVAQEMVNHWLVIIVFYEHTQTIVVEFDLTSLGVNFISNIMFYQAGSRSETRPIRCFFKLIWKSLLSFDLGFCWY